MLEKKLQNKVGFILYKISVFSFAKWIYTGSPLYVLQQNTISYSINISISTSSYFTNKNAICTNRCTKKIKPFTSQHGIGLCPAVRTIR